MADDPNRNNPFFQPTLLRTPLFRTEGCALKETLEMDPTANDVEWQPDDAADADVSEAGVAVVSGEDGVDCGDT